MRLDSFAIPLAILAVAVVGRAAAPPEGASRAKPAQPAEERRPEVLVEAQAPPFSEGIFPCSSCHADQKDRTRRELGFHDEQQSVFDHDAEHRWCLDCHDYENRDVLRLASGATVPFTESYRLCGQCHGDKYRDWRVGVHGRRVGRWDGEKTYLLCVNCHNPHSPAWKGVKEITVDGKKTTAPTLERIAPEPRPLRPEEMRRRPAAPAAAQAGEGK
jgi:hypothetical protein